mgnify:CR=1 FL=1|jgi:hypothetical protein
MEHTKRTLGRGLAGLAIATIAVGAVLVYVYPRVVPPASMSPASSQQQPPSVAEVVTTPAKIDVEEFESELMPVPPPPPESLEQSLEIVEMGEWKPVVEGITPPGWKVAPDPERELEYSAPGIKVRVPVYRIVPEDGSIYIIEPGRESGFDVPQVLAASASRMEEEAAIFEATANALQKLLPPMPLIPSEEEIKGDGSREGNAGDFEEDELPTH